MMCPGGDPMKCIASARLRWAQQVELLELHRELTRQRQAALRDSAERPEAQATTVFRIKAVQHDLRRIQQQPGGAPHDSP